MHSDPLLPFDISRVKWRIPESSGHLLCTASAGTYRLNEQAVRNQIQHDCPLVSGKKEDAVVSVTAGEPPHSAFRSPRGRSQRSTGVSTPIISIVACLQFQPDQRRDRSKLGSHCRQASATTTVRYAAGILIIVVLSANKNYRRQRGSRSSRPQYLSTCRCGSDNQPHFSHQQPSGEHRC